MPRPDVAAFRQAALGQEPGADPRPLWTDAMIQRGLDAVQPDDDVDEEESCAEERVRLAIYDRIGLEAANAIKVSDKWADNHWPSAVERIWYTAAQEEIASLRAELAALRGLEATRGFPPEIRELVPLINGAVVAARSAGVLSVLAQQSGQARIVRDAEAADQAADYTLDKLLRGLDAGPPPPDVEASRCEYCRHRKDLHVAGLGGTQCICGCINYRPSWVRASPSEGEGQYWCERCGGVILPLSEAIWVARKPYHVIHVPGHEPPPTPSPTFRPVGLMPDAVVVRASPSEGEPPANVAEENARLKAMARFVDSLLCPECVSRIALGSFGFDAKYNAELRASAPSPREAEP